MRTAAIAFLALLLPLQARAQSVELTLNCNYESAFDVMKRQTRKTSGDFSAIVRMQEGATPSATIEATTTGCFDYVGSFNELGVSGDCERAISLGDSVKKFKVTLSIDRISGTFQHNVLFGDSYTWYYGRCTPAKKLF